MKFRSTRSPKSATETTGRAVRNLHNTGAQRLTGRQRRGISRQVRKSRTVTLLPIGLDDRREIRRRCAVQDYAIATEVELAVDARNTALWGAHRRRCEPCLRYQFSDLFELFGRC